MKKAAILDPKAQRNYSSGYFQLHFEESLNKFFFLNSNYLTLESLKYHFK